VTHLEPLRDAVAALAIAALAVLALGPRARGEAHRWGVYAGAALLAAALGWRVATAPLTPAPESAALASGEAPPLSGIAAQRLAPKLRGPGEAPFAPLRAASLAALAAAACTVAAAAAGRLHGGTALALAAALVASPAATIALESPDPAWLAAALLGASATAAGGGIAGAAAAAALGVAAVSLDLRALAFAWFPAAIALDAGCTRRGSAAALGIAAAMAVAAVPALRGWHGAAGGGSPFGGADSIAALALAAAARAFALLPLLLPAAAVLGWALAQGRSDALWPLAAVAVAAVLAVADPAEASCAAWSLAPALPLLVRGAEGLRARLGGERALLAAVLAFAIAGADLRGAAASREADALRRETLAWLQRPMPRPSVIFAGRETAWFGAAVPEGSSWRVAPAVDALFPARAIADSLRRGDALFVRDSQDAFDHTAPENLPIALRRLGYELDAQPRRGGLVELHRPQ
jgi:hypothetical protein